MLRPGAPHCSSNHRRLRLVTTIRVLRISYSVVLAKHSFIWKESMSETLVREPPNPRSSTHASDRRTNIALRLCCNRLVSGSPFWERNWFVLSIQTFWKHRSAAVSPASNEAAWLEATGLPRAFVKARVWCIVSDATSSHACRRLNGGTEISLWQPHWYRSCLCFLK